LIDAAMDGDVGALIAKIQYTAIECATQPSGVGLPPTCDGGESKGSKVQVFPLALCDGEYVRPSDVPGLFEKYLKKANLYAVITLKRPDVVTMSGFSTGVYGIIFETASSAAMLSVNDAGKIVNLWRGCGEFAAGLYDDRFKASVVLPPMR
jgi:hypothetical protein